MRNLFTTTWAILLLACCTTAAWSQVDVTATAGTTGPTSYSTVNAAFTAINAGTHQGVITIRITANTTEPATPVPLLRSNSPSNYTSVTIIPSGNVTVNSAAAPTTSRGIIELVGADNVTIDGDDPGTSGTRNLTFQMATTTTTGTQCIRLASNSTTGADGADNNTVKNCNIIGGRSSATSTTTSWGILMSNSTAVTTGAYSSMNTLIENNIITRCYTGIGAIGASATYLNSGTIIRNNVLGSATSADNIGSRGILISYSASTAGVGSATIRNNDIRVGDYGATGYSTTIAGIEVGTVNAGLIIDRNNIHDINQPSSGGYGAHGIYITGSTSTSGVTMTNNFIRDCKMVVYQTSTTSTFIPTGVFFTAGATNVVLDHNTIVIGTQLGSGANFSSFCVNSSVSGVTFASVRNNILVNTHNSTSAYCFYTAATSNISGGTVNNNDYYVTGSASVGYYNSATRSTLSAWQTATGKDAASVSVSPPFVSATDLHIQTSPAPPAVPLFQTGDAGTGVTVDYDNESRATPPCIGADEFVLSICSSAVAGNITGNSVACVASSNLLSLSGATSGLGVTQQWAYGPVGGPYSTPLGTDATQNTNGLPAGNWEVICTVTCAYCGPCSNSTAPFAITINANPTATAGSNSPVCVGSPLDLSVLTDIGTTFSWTGPNSFSSSDQNPVIASATLAAAGTYNVTVTASGCSTMSSTVVTVNPGVSATASATPPTVCAGGNTQLNVAAVQSFTTPAVATYNFAGSSGAYTTLTGTTNPAPTVLTGSTILGDDVGVGNLPIGFTFNYNGSFETVFGISSNGFIQLGNTSATFSGFSSNALASTAKVIAPFWDDNNTTATTIQYRTAGTAPNRTLTVEWGGIKIGGGGSGTHTLNMQAILYEATGVVQFVYGSSTTGTGTISATIGISGASGNYRSVTPLSPANTSTSSTSTENTGISAFTNIPSGTTYTFTPTGAPSFIYAWSENPVSPTTLAATNIANPMANGITEDKTYTVIVTGNGGCTATSSVTVTAGAALTATPTATQSNICEGQSSTLAAGAAGGGAPYTYLWDDPAGSTTATISVSPSSTTTYNVIITDDCNATTTGSVTVIVHPVPTATAGSNSPVCVGSALNLTVSTDIGDTFTWSGPNSFSSTLQNPSISNATSAVAGTYNVTVALGICSATSSTIVTTNPSPVINSTTATPAAICSGGNSTLTVALPGPSSYCTVAFTSSVEAISLVQFADINNSSACATGAGAGGALQDFTSIMGNVVAGSAYTMTLSGTTAGNYTNYFTAFFDWNQDGVFETAVPIGSILNTVCIAQATNTVTVPLTALNGTTRMRIVKNFNASPSNPCGSYSYGQAEDYTLNVTGGANAYTYLWDDPTAATTSSVVVLPVANTTYNVVVTNANGCSSIGQVAVTINPAPTATVSGGGTVCSGDPLPNVSFALTGTGPWNLTYNNGANDVPVTGINTSPYVITNAPAGTYTVVSGSDVNCAGTGSGSVIVAVNTPTTWYADTDNDGFGDPNMSTSSCTQPFGYVANNTDLCPADPDKQAPGACGCGIADTDTDGDNTPDCNDGCPNDPNKTAPGACGCGVADVPATWYADTDNDGFGDPNNSVTGFACDQPAGYVANNTDLCPADPNKQVPGACGCGVADVAATYYADADGDGFGAGPAIPGFTCVVPTGTVTNNTDLCPTDPNKQAPGACGCGVADVATTWYADTDGDTYGDPNSSIPGFTCNQPVGYVANNTDCDDTNNAINPGATEVVNGIDDNCNGMIDETGLTYYRDMDGDGFGDPNNSMLAGSPPIGYVLDNTDCNDNNALEKPGQTWYKDTDGDNYAETGAVTIIQCTRPTGYKAASELTANTGDCNDNNAAINPGATEVCNGIDDDCDGSTDEGVLTTYYLDADGDGYYTGAPVTACTSPGAGYVTSVTGGGDCNDGNDDINPGTNELCNGIDDNCNGSTDEGFDADNDGIADCFDNCPNTPNSVIRPIAIDGNIGDFGAPIANGNAGVNYYFSADNTYFYIGVTGVNLGNDNLHIAFSNADGSNNGTNWGVNWSNTPYTYLITIFGPDDICYYPFNDPNGCQQVGNGGGQWQHFAGWSGNPTTEIRIPRAYLGSLNGGSGLVNLTIYSNNNSGTYVWTGYPTSNPQGNAPVTWNSFGQQTYPTYLPQVDADNDGFGAACDCNDNNANINPNATEVCDGIDNDCDSMIDEGLSFTTYYVDNDGDGFGTGNGQSLCSNPGAGYSTVAGDCNDNNADINPNAAEVCDGIDNDCDSMIDEGLSFTTYYVDNDGDGFGTGNGQSLCSNPGAGYSTVAGDCNDNNANINPNAAEVCDGIDNDCDSMIDEGLSFTTYYVDNDGDGFGTGNGQSLCSNPGAGYSTVAGDCNDNNANINPNAAEVCDGIDNDCDSMIDEGLSFTTYYVDNDGDGFGTGNGQTLCSNPGAGYSTVAGDCNDNNADIKPNATEVCDGIDNDCDGLVDSADPNYVDNTPPTVTCAGTATLNFNGQTGIQIDGPNSPVNLQIVANDNCGIASTMISPSTITASQVGQAVPVTITVTDGKGNTAQCVTTVNVSGLPAGWSSTPAGVGCAGGNNVGYNTSSGTWTVTSTNCFYGPPYTGDSEAFAQRTLCGDGSITALVTGINPLAGGWAGIVMRESNAAGAKKAQLMTNLGSDHRREFRTITNGAVTPQQFSSLSRYWLRIVRTGNQFTMFVSSNGSSWFPAGAQNIVMGNCIEMGLIVTNYTANSTVTATFSNVSFTQVTPPSVNTINVQPTLGQVEFDVFPNPTSGALNLNLEQYIGRSVRIETYSLEGKLLQFAELDEVQNTLERLDLSRFQNGMYLVKVKSAGLPDVTRRIVKQ
ncbi:MAG TPA: MopE-related protein [Saprospiraceae bacterium]|nr:MopE-related protein [Saprospiraceae bacterium]